jgi:uncharacterized membrane protein YGL010W
VRSLEDNLAQYAASHRDRRNIATHFVGIPLIVFSAVVALALVSFPVAGVVITLAAAASVAACAYWLLLDAPLGIAMAVILFLMGAAASEITARLPWPAVLALSAAVFVAGWALQFWGHWFEGRKPAFVDDVKQLLIGPLFVLVEFVFLFGGRPALRRYIEERAGPVVARRERTPGNGPR